MFKIEFKLDRASVLDYAYLIQFWKSVSDICDQFRMFDVFHISLYISYSVLDIIFIFQLYFDVSYWNFEYFDYLQQVDFG